MNDAVVCRAAGRAPGEESPGWTEVCPQRSAGGLGLRAVAPRPPLPEELEQLVCRGRELVLRRRREAHGAPLPTGLSPLDAVLGGGLTRGAITEIAGARSCGRMAAVVTALAEVTGNGENAALVDLGDHLDAEAAQQAGADLRRILWLRPHRLPEALEMTERLLQAGFPLVVTDLGLPPVHGRVSPGAWIRIAREAAAHGGTVLLSSPYPAAGHTPAAVVRLVRARGRWSGRRGISSLLEGASFACTVLRRRGERPGERARGILWSPGTFTHGESPSTAAPDADASRERVQPRPVPRLEPGIEAGRMSIMSTGRLSGRRVAQR